MSIIVGVTKMTYFAKLANLARIHQRSGEKIIWDNKRGLLAVGDFHQNCKLEKTGNWARIHQRFCKIPNEVTKREILTNGDYRAFSLTWPAYMQIYCNKRKRLHKKRVQLPEDWFGTPTWPPFHCFGTPIWPPWRHVKTLYKKIANFGRKGKIRQKWQVCQKFIRAFAKYSNKITKEGI